ncbi:MAG: STAS domain-containing protein [Kouleothrix sp.]|nr:STAS domain-containing protein [Kouleothrix sp.]
MHLSQRRGTLIAMGVQLAGVLLLVLALLGRGPTPAFLFVCGAAVVYAAAMAAYWRGWEYARALMVVAVTLVTGFTTPLSGGFNVSILMPAIVALVVLNPAWVLGSAIATLAIVLIRSEGQGSYVDPEGLVLFVGIVGSLIISRLVTDTSQRDASENARAAQEERARTQVQARDLAESNRRQEEQLVQQQRLLDLVATLEAAAVQLADGVLFVPIVGHLDSQRAQMLTSRLLQQAHDQRARLVILDIAGVGVVDTAVAQAILKAAQALRLLGCDVCVSGVSANVASTLVHLGVGLESITTVRSPQEALARYADLIGAAGAAPSQGRAA